MFFINFHEKTARVFGSSGTPFISKRFLLNDIVFIAAEIRHSKSVINLQHLNHFFILDDNPRILVQRISLNEIRGSKVSRKVLSIFLLGMRIKYKRKIV